MDTVHECGRWTNGQTVRQTDITITKIVQHIASHGKNDVRDQRTSGKEIAWKKKCGQRGLRTTGGRWKRQNRTELVGSSGA